MNDSEKILAKLDELIELMQIKLVIDLRKSGVPREEIRKKLKIGQKAIVRMMESLPKE